MAAEEVHAHTVAASHARAKRQRDREEGRVKRQAQASIGVVLQGQGASADPHDTGDGTFASMSHNVPKQQQRRRMPKALASNSQKASS